MQGLAFMGVLLIVAGNVIFFVFPVLLAIVGGLIEEMIGLARWAVCSTSHLFGHTPHTAH